MALLVVTVLWFHILVPKLIESAPLKMHRFSHVHQTSRKWLKKRDGDAELSALCPGESQPHSPGTTGTSPTQLRDDTGEEARILGRAG